MEPSLLSVMTADTVEFALRRSPAAASFLDANKIKVPSSSQQHRLAPFLAHSALYNQHELFNAIARKWSNAAKREMFRLEATANEETQGWVYGPLILAAELGHVEFLRTYCAMFYEVNRMQPDLGLVLLSAANGGAIRTFQWLLNSGHLEEPYRVGLTTFEWHPLHSSSFGGSPEGFGRPGSTTSLRTLLQNPSTRAMTAMALFTCFLRRGLEQTIETTAAMTALFKAVDRTYPTDLDLSKMAHGLFIRDSTFSLADKTDELAEALDLPLTERACRKYADSFFVLLRRKGLNTTIANRFIWLLEKFPVDQRSSIVETYLPEIKASIKSRRVFEYLDKYNYLAPSSSLLTWVLSVDNERVDQTKTTARRHGLRRAMFDSAAFLLDRIAAGSGTGASSADLALVLDVAKQPESHLDGIKARGIVRLLLYYGADPGVPAVRSRLPKENGGNRTWYSGFHDDVMSAIRWRRWLTKPSPESLLPPEIMREIMLHCWRSFC